MITFFRLTSILIILPFVLSFPLRVEAQLDPSKTVNPATGEMGFALPLGTVKGLNGHDFPINLYYSAGIHYWQKASPTGLGFSYGAHRCPLMSV